MKELSIEEKAKRYEEALAMAKECITYIPDEAVNKYMLNMFPELKESEDERIRKEIIEFIKVSKPEWENYSDYSSWIAWLEKQNNADKVKQQQSIEIPFGAKDSELQEATYYIPDGYHAEINGNEVIIKKGEQKSSWSEEDEKKRTLLIRILEVNHPNGYFKVNPANTLNMEAIHTEELVSWLKSL